MVIMAKRLLLVGAHAHDDDYGGAVAQDGAILQIIG